MDPYVVTDNEPFFSAAFGKEIAKSIVISAAVSAGVFGGMIAIGLIAQKLEVRKDRKKKSQKSALTN